MAAHGTARIEQRRRDDDGILVRLWEVSVRETHDFLEERDIDIYRPMVREGLCTSDTYVYRDVNGTCMGFIVLTGNKVDMLFVDPAAYRMGVGSALIRFAENQRGLLDVDVNEQNTGAVRFYGKMGFRTIGRSDTDDTGRPYPLLHMSQRPD